mgnify:FL=1
MEETENIFEHMAPPVLVVTSGAGGGNKSIGETFSEKMKGIENTIICIDEFLPENAVNEDVHRYKFIIEHFRPLLYLAYKTPFVYLRKYVREKYFGSDLSSLEEKVKSINPKTVICISHRPAFWLSALKGKKGFDFELCCLITDFGANIGYKYLFWSQINTILSFINMEALGFSVPAQTKFKKINLISKKGYIEIKEHEGNKISVLISGGYWGLGDLTTIVEELDGLIPGLNLHIDCGKNKEIYQILSNRFKDNKNTLVYSELESLTPIMRECASIITKPGLATLM